MLTDEVKRLLREQPHAGDPHESLPDIIVPASFNFPHTGKLLSLSYVLFAGWFADAAIAVHDYPRLAFTGFFTLFGSLNVAMPFLLDMFRIPADTFQLFLASSVVNARFGTLIGGGAYGDDRAARHLRPHGPAAGRRAPGGAIPGHHRRTRASRPSAAHGRCWPSRPSRHTPGTAR